MFRHYAQRIKVASYTLGALVAFGTLATYAETGWYNYGWKTPRAVDVAVGTVSENFGDFRREYKCDKLKDKIRKAQLLDNIAPEKVPELARLQTIYDGIHCADFEF